MALPPIDNPFNRRYNGPLSAEDVEEIEEKMNELVARLFADDLERLEAEIEAPLAEKIDGYISIAEYAATAPHLMDMPGIQELAPMLRELLTEVNAYYNALN